MQGRFKREGRAAEDAEPDGATDREPSAGAAPGDAADGDRPAPDGAAAGDDASATPSAPRRPSQAGSRLALRNWRISTRLVSLVALPVVAATILGGLRLQTALADIEQLDDMQLLTDMTEQATRLATALQEERDRTAGPLMTGMDTRSDEIAGPREDTDEARHSFSDATLRIDNTDEAMRGIQSSLDDISSQLGELDSVRKDAYQDRDYVSQTISSYNNMITSLLSLTQDMAQATGNGEMIRATRALAAFAAAKEHASIQRAVITAGLARGEIDGEVTQLSESDWRYGRTNWLNEDAKLGSFEAIYDGDRDHLNALLAPLNGGQGSITQADQYAQQVFAAEEGIDRQPRTYLNWFDQDRTKIEAMDRIQQQLLDELLAKARDLQDQAEDDAVLNGAIVLLVLGITLVGAFIVARSMVRSLRRLQTTAQEVAHKRLPEVVKRMSEAEPEDVDTSVEPIGVYTRDEIGRVAEAFDDVHREAVRLAGEQALLRGNVNAMFTNLSRRSQGLIQRQLSLISELESREADPDQLSSLFKLDHLATRMRRNGENLLVLAGEEPGRRWTRPVPLVDVLRAAASEVEQYERIELSAVPKTDVAGRVVNDLVHLLAELLENATSFSSPQTKVKVTGHALPDGRVLVEIHDTGIGLSPEDLADINDRLANPPTVDVSVSRRMGLFVVGRLSLRHGIRIQLRPSDSGGTTALVMLPADVANGGFRPRPADAAGGRPTATLEREQPPGRGAGDGGGRPGDTDRAPGWQRSLDRAEHGRGQVTGRADRPALPSRPVGASGAPAPDDFPAPPQAAPPAPPRQAPEPPVPAGPGADRPSWASAPDESGRIPAARADRDQPRGHDEHDSMAASTAQFPAVGPDGFPQRADAPGQGHQSRSSMADAFAARQARAQAQQDDEASRTGEYGFPPARPGEPAGDTGAFPAAQPYGDGQQTGYQGQDYRAQGYQEPDYQQQAYQDPGYRTPEYQDQGYPTPDHRDSGYREPGPQDDAQHRDYRGADYAGQAQDPGYRGDDRAARDYQGQDYREPGYQDGAYSGYRAPEPAASGYDDDSAFAPPAHRDRQGHQEPAPRARDERPDDVRSALSARQTPRTSERTPIFEEMETTWFGLRRAPGAPAQPSREPAGSRQSPQNAPAPARPAQPGPAAGGHRSDEAPAPRRESGDGGSGTPWRSSPNDERWRQAEQLRQPSAGGVTTSGLPRRVPRANLVAGAAQQHQQATPVGPAVSRRPDDVRGRLTNLRRGIQQGRQAGTTAGRSDRGSGPTYQ
ncbi:nitrate- and nitrite sensing domain-containing protein [Streptomyces sp. RFCAC02]|uniref:sensor histidine kinase n=1 Tax=Streptomyces sp. RFCAC02 TaxID=2499143 RepID=UPI001021214E|nr:nitrate- and nitrite sensing domain-containing protein [Streptomyces sp. RFCAC02]